MAVRALVPLRIPRRQILAFALVVDGLLATLHLVGHWLAHHGEQAFGRRFEGYTLFDLDGEVSVPTWWAQSQLLLAAALAVAIGVLLRRFGESDHRFWVALGLIFVLFSIDEGSEIHERFIEPMRAIFGVSGGVLWFAWLIPGLAGLALFAAIFFRFWLRMAPSVRAPMAIGGVLFVAGAVGVEMVGGSYESANGQDFTYSLITGLEESLELVGATVFLHSLLTMVQHVVTTKSLRLEVAVSDGERAAASDVEASVPRGQPVEVERAPVSLSRG